MNTPLRQRKRNNDLRNSHQGSVLNSNESDPFASSARRSNPISLSLQFSDTPLRRPPKKDTVGDVVEDEEKIEQTIQEAQIDDFEIWDWIEVKFSGATKRRVLLSLEKHDLTLQAGIQESEDQSSRKSERNGPE